MKLKAIKVLIALHLVTFVICIFFLLPTNDDWGYLTTPKIDGYSYEGLLPTGTFWRPWDCLFGIILTWRPVLFPFLNHLFVIVGHFIGACILWKLLTIIKVSKFPKEIATIIFVVSPATLGSVLGIDSLNEIYSITFGLFSLLLYFNYPNKYYWIILALFATFAKENGIVYFLICPLVYHIFVNSNKKKILLDCIIGLSVAVLYFIARVSLETSVVSISEESPYAFSLSRKLTDIVAFVIGTSSVVDYISVLHAPSRNLTIAIITFIISFIFVIKVFGSKKSFNSTIIKLFVIMIICASPHLATHFGPMHAYSTLPFFCIILGVIIDQRTLYNNVGFSISLYFYLLTAIFVDWHHLFKSYKSGIVGPEMALQVIKACDEKPNRVLCLTYKDTYPRYSSFCVPPRDVFRGGGSCT